MRFLREKEVVSFGAGRTMPSLAMLFKRKSKDILRDSGRRCQRFMSFKTPPTSETGELNVKPAFDYNQEDSRVLLVREYGEKGLQWRTYLLCESQDGRLGTKARLYTDNAGLVSAYVYDFTHAAEQFGWERIYAQQGRSKGPTKKEFWL
jgi:hypothetical protein